MKHKIFIGSSVEGLPIAEKIKKYLSGEFECSIWNEDIFRFNENFLETLIRVSGCFDIGLLIFTKDDEIKSRGVIQSAPRDNILFEYGLFLGVLGRNRAYVISDKDVKLPSDLSGISLVRFKEDVNGLLIGADGSDFSLALDKLQKEIKEKLEMGILGILPSTVLAYNYFENFVRPVCKAMINPSKIVVKEKEYKKCNDFEIKIVIPNELVDNLKDYAQVYYQDEGCDDIMIYGELRPYHCKGFEKDGEKFYIRDIPTTFSGLRQAINVFFKKDSIGMAREQKMVEERELLNFKNVLSILLKEDGCSKELYKNHKIVFG